ncbi:GAF domain-containing protein [Desulfuromonas sp. AOP6]|uniref:GAF domain-containing protein n=1 Tax=Desulfuromonas sp. AOP6 TaxID=1566351 RepID=UPI001283FCBC|nr:GAF domain-containing protein [Desulfuromonas sp. AOP6]BCA79471.1 histidine kinase [Desulfuromonas sp. AOP6]
MRTLPDDMPHGFGLAREDFSCVDDKLLCDRKLSILKEISSAILVTDNINTIGHLILDLVMDHLQAEKSSLMMANSHQELYILCSRGIDETLAHEYRVKFGEGIAGFVAQQGEPVLVADIGADERFSGIPRDRYRTRSFISCPIMGKGGILGVLNVNDKRDGTPFDETEFALVRILAGHASIALKNAFLVNQYKSKAVELEDVNRKLINADVSRTEFLTRMSHELRTPLNSITGAVYLLKSAPHLEAAQRSEFYEIIHSETSKLISFVEKQLDFLRLQDESRVLKKSVISLQDIIRETFNSRTLQAVFGRRSLKFDLVLDQNIPEIVGDKILVSQMFINLFEGIVSHLHMGSTIRIAVHENDVVQLVIQTTNPLPDYIVRNFFHAKNFYFAEKAEEYTKLYLALKAAEIHGWSMKGNNVDGFFEMILEIPRGSSQKASATIANSLDLVLEFAAELLGVNTGSLMLNDALTGDLIISSALGLDDEIIKKTRIKLGEQIAGWVASEGEPLLIGDIESDPRFKRKNIDNQYSSKSLLSVPLKMDDQILGVLNLSNKKSGHSFELSDLKVASLMAARISRLIARLHAENATEEDQLRILGSLDTLLQAERHYDKKGSRLPRLVQRLMEKLVASEEECALALYVARIFDLGLALIDKDVLDKTVPLSPLEKTTVKGHPYTAVNLIEELEPDPAIRQIILHHHEYFDGSGYPDQLEGRNIPLLSRVLAVADSFCALTENRAYRKAVSEAEALDEIRRQSGTRYDPRIVEALEALVGSS